MNDYASLSFWGNALQSMAVTCVSDYLVDVLGNYNIAECDGVRDLAAFAVSELQNNRVPTTQDAIDLWQISQCLKKFRYGGAPSPEEMKAGWVQRNAKCGEPLVDEPSWLIEEARKLLVPLGPAYDAVGDTGLGRFGNGKVYEGYTSIARWNALIREASYWWRDPDDVRMWRGSSALSARLSCVPKDMYKLRSITVEPSEATFLQQLTRSRLIAAAARCMDRLSAIPQQAWGAGPEMQQRRCLLGSLTGHLATIDLSDASDSVRWDIVQRIFPKNVLADLEKSRSCYVDVDGTRYRCHMFAGMGNATTFIVESLYFWSLCTALSHWLRDFTPVSVFGDDIVLSRKVAAHPLFNHYLSRLGIVMNMAKSGLSEGPGFREACGVVAYQGETLPLYRIRGYRASNPDELVAMCGLVNTVLCAGDRHASFLRDVFVDVGRRIREDFRPPLLPAQPFTAGIYIVDPSEEVGPWSCRVRWDPNCQHVEVKCRVTHRTGKTVRMRDLTLGEAQGVLAGQLRTPFHDARIGYSTSRSDLILNDPDFQRSEVIGTWVPVYELDREWVELLTQSQSPQPIACQSKQLPR